MHRGAFVVKSARLAATGQKRRAPHRSQKLQRLPSTGGKSESDFLNRFAVVPRNHRLLRPLLRCFSFLLQVLSSFFDFLPPRARVSLSTQKFIVVVIISRSSQHHRQHRQRRVLLRGGQGGICVASEIEAYQLLDEAIVTPSFQGSSKGIASSSSAAP